MAQTWLDAMVAGSTRRALDMIEEGIMGPPVDIGPKFVLTDHEAARWIVQYCMASASQHPPTNAASWAVLEGAIFCSCIAPYFRTTRDNDNLFADPCAALQPSRDLVALLANAQPPQNGHAVITPLLRERNWYFDIPHRALLVGEGHQIRAMFTSPSEREDAPVFCVVVTFIGSDDVAFRCVWKYRRHRTHARTQVDACLDLDEPYLMQSVEALVGLLLLHYSVRASGEPKVWLPHLAPKDMYANPRRVQQRRKTHSLFRVLALEAPADRFGRARPATTSAGEPSGWRLDFRQPVAGHYKLQPYGPRNSLRKLIWVDGYERGPEEGRVRPNLEPLGVAA